jgi:hypothetical protein
MRTLLRFGLAAAVGVALGGAANAQTNGTGSTGGTGTTGGGGGGGSSGQTLGDALQFQTPSSLDQSLGNQIGSSGLNQSNILGRYYANPYYQGRAGAESGEIPGGFGQPLYGTGGGTGGRAGGASGGRSATGASGAGRTSTGSSSGFAGTNSGFGSTMGLGGATTGFGGAGGRTGFGGTAGRTGFGGAGGLGGRAGIGGGGFGGMGGIGGAGGRGGLGGMGTSNAAQVVPMSRQINYTATLQLPRQPVAAVAPRMQADLRAMIDRSTMIANPQGVQVVTNGSVVLLRGTARDEDEARLIEGMVRLTPGVRDVRNEIKFPEPPPQQP